LGASPHAALPQLELVFLATKQPALGRASRARYSRHARESRDCVKLGEAAEGAPRAWLETVCPEAFASTTAFDWIFPAGAGPDERRPLPAEAAAETRALDDDRRLAEEAAEDNTGAAIWASPGDSDEGVWLAPLEGFALPGEAKAIVA